MLAPGSIHHFDRHVGGAKKTVFMGALDSGLRFAVYVWNSSANYFANAQWISGPQDAVAFANAHRRLTELGVRVPRLLHLDTSRSSVRHDIAIVEAVPDGLDGAFLDSAPGRVALRRLGGMLRVMHADAADFYGPPGTGPADSQQTLPEVLVHERAISDLRMAGEEEPELAFRRGVVEQVLQAWRNAVRPRRQFGLIHGELGPGHVHLDSCGEPVLIDIEGIHYFDIEMEHSYLDLRWEQHCLTMGLDSTTLDPTRLRFYRLCRHLSIAAGFVTLLRGGYPDQEFCAAVLGANARAALQMAEAAAR